MAKLDFKDVVYDSSTICWGKGNKVVGLNLIARIQLREPTKADDRKAKRDYLDAKKIYDTYINKGQRFKPNGDKANKAVTGKITFINNKNQMVSWKQDNLTAEELAIGYIPAAGKLLINSMISMFRSKQIVFLTPTQQ